MIRNTNKPAPRKRPAKRGRALVDVAAPHNVAMLGSLAALGMGMLLSFKRTGFVSPKFTLAVGLSLLSTTVWLFGGPGGVVTAVVTTSDWMSFQEWLFGIYATAETGVHGVNAIVNRNQPAA